MVVLETQVGSLNENESNLPSDFENAIVTLPLINSPEICLLNFSDYCKVSQYRWMINKNGYVCCSIHRKIVTLHHLILGKFVDHRDRNPLNNCRYNLRFASFKQQAQNKEKRTGKYSSKYKGVHYKKDCNKWTARILVEGRRLHLGYFDTEQEAAIAYNEAATKYFGEFACLNIIC